MSKLIINALLADAQAQETKAVANLNNYFTNPAGIGEHPDIVAECKKLLKDIAEARELREVVNSIQPTENKSESNNNQ
jgi:hypothetical protein|tara:strand:+ start:2105 stop:2338 length:234 start_codon:yes stop_codon:yes gene_type:complete